MFGVIFYIFLVSLFIFLSFLSCLQVCSKYKLKATLSKRKAWDRMLYRTFWNQVKRIVIAVISSCFYTMGAFTVLHVIKRNMVKYFKLFLRSRAEQVNIGN